MLRPRSAGFSVGKPGRDNQDAYALLARPDGTAVYVIADGVGGSSNGRLSARIAVECVESWVKDSSQDLSIPFKQADLKLKSIVDSEPASYKSLATTLTLVSVRGIKATFAHVGDCRLYLLRGTGLKTLTQDQTEARMLIELGVLRKERAKDYKRSHVLLSALGSTRPFELQIGTVDLKPRDRLLLCSDGFYNAVEKKDIVAMSTRSNTVDDFMSELQDATIDSEPSDDATVVALEI